MGYKWKEIYQRGDEFYDWDGHAFHFIGGIPKNADGSLVMYTPKEQDEYLRELAESVKKGVQPYSSKRSPPATQQHWGGVRSKDANA